MSQKLIKRMFVHSEMIAAGEWAALMRKPDYLDEITLSLACEEGGCKWEFGIELIRLQGKAAMRARIFSDSWKAFEEAPEIFEVLRKFGRDSGDDDEPLWPEFLAALEAVGWKRVKPEPRKKPEPVLCPTCGK